MSSSFNEIEIHSVRSRHDGDVPGDADRHLQRHPPVKGAPAPEALYTVELTDAEWAVGVKVGLRFETTAYDV